MIVTAAGQEDCPGALEVFWETAAQTDFVSDTERREFVFKYFGYYRDCESALFLVARDDIGVCGYICGVARTREHQALYPISDHLPLFDDLYDEYPAHLHINVHARTRGQGIGAKLLRSFEEALAGATPATSGVHLVTSAGARNVSFYLRNGYTFTVERALGGAGLLFMGKRLYHSK